MMNQAPDTEITDSAWNGLYIVGGAAALIAALLFRRNIGSEMLILKMLNVIDFGPATTPSSAIDWLQLLQKGRFLGLALLNLFDQVNYALVGMIYLAINNSVAIYQEPVKP